MWNAVITNGGKSLFATWVTGAMLNFDSAASGSGTVQTVSLMAQTALVSKKQTLRLLGGEKVTDGIRLKIQITAPEEGYTLNQIGVWGSIDGGASTMLAIFQNDDGVTIPSYSQTPDFVYNFFGTIVVSNTGTFTLTIDTSALVSVSTLEGAIKAHDEDGDAHDGQFATLQGNLTTHSNDKSNPHAVTAAQVGADPSGSAAAVQTNLTAALDMVALSTTVWTETSSSTTTRTVTIDDVTSWNDVLNKPLYIKAATYGTNTATTLNINGLGAKTMYFPNISSSGVATTPQYYWVRTAQVYCIVWTGTYLVVTNMQVQNATTSYAGITTLVNSVASTSTTAAAVPNSVKIAYDKAAEAAETAQANLTTAVSDITTQLANKADVEDIPTFIYNCTGSADSTTIANIVNDFFNNGTAMSMKLIITGTMGIGFTNTYYAMYINATNIRGAVCYLDFSDCDIPTITTSIRDFLYVTSSTAKLNITGLVVTTTRICVYLSISSDNSFSDCILKSTGSQAVNLFDSNNNSFYNCTLVGSYYGVAAHAAARNSRFFGCTIVGDNYYGVNLSAAYYGEISFISCKIVGAIHGFFAQTANTTAIIRLINCSIRGSGSAYDVNQTTAASTMSWYIMGCVFAYSQVYINGAAITASTATTNAYLYMPAYANMFSRTIE